MKFTEKTGSLFEVTRLRKNHPFSEMQACSHFTMIWNSKGIVNLLADSIEITIPENHILCLSPNQMIHITQAEGTQWMIQFNKEFYCIINHDKEVSCVGLLFYSPGQNTTIHVEELQAGRINFFFMILSEEFDNEDSLQGEMLRILLKRLIIISTRLAKEQFLPKDYDPRKLDIFRHFNYLVELHYKSEHKVNFYAEKLHKSPKTLSNRFALSHFPSPLEIIHNRLIIEAKKLLLYTSLSQKEIAAILGFSEAGHFNRLFKQKVQQTPAAFRNSAT